MLNEQETVPEAPNVGKGEIAATMPAGIVTLAYFDALAKRGEDPSRLGLFRPLVSIRSD